ncbi:glycerophosphodiester phosphodiesterase family protein [Subtercola boreus]|uniref:Glycerophosphodiester phosphodiesterase n=1 Tax=Subtercola boreus TaxID=120213 RepID=A0A3E0WC90_9MICO|nr:glycerophosphodiester phosphodiesterase family protein [Subtercola boreus]RFA21204.1 glycerophosphodiester phosphodiesterase [Subtercola boreus]RFA21587.1 glycerophosphodiester phosphodiesterase [Subtercola boreus]RFA27556.1 glycerophosphodiester phosphodiesterase [Subtercola boreus]
MRRPRAKRAEPAGYFAPPLPRLLAHRGLATTEVENTIPAFRAAVDRGATYVECDVHASSDGVAVVAHDPSLTRLLGSDQTIGGLTAARLAAIDLGAGCGFPTLEDALTALPGTFFNIDVKADAAAAPAAAAIRACGATHRVLVTSFSNRRRRAAVRLLPGVATSASARTFALALVAGRLRLAPVVRWVLRNVDAVQVPETALGLRVTTPRLLAMIHSAGVEMHVWTINDPVRMAELLALGVDGIVTDRVDLALGLIAETKRKRL